MLDFAVLGKSARKSVVPSLKGFDSIQVNLNSDRRQAMPNSSRSRNAMNLKLESQESQMSGKIILRNL